MIIGNPTVRVFVNGEQTRVYEIKPSSISRLSGELSDIFRKEQEPVSPMDQLFGERYSTWRPTLVMTPGRDGLYVTLDGKVMEAKLDVLSFLAQKYGGVVFELFGSDGKYEFLIHLTNKTVPNITGDAVIIRGKSYTFEATISVTSKIRPRIYPKDLIY